VVRKTHEQADRHSYGLFGVGKIGGHTFDIAGGRYNCIFKTYPILLMVRLNFLAAAMRGPILSWSDVLAPKEKPRGRKWAQNQIVARRARDGG